MWKRALLLTVLVGGFVVAGSSNASAARWRRSVVYRRPVAAPVVRQVVRHAAWATYPVVARPVVRAYTYGPYGYDYGYPAFYNPGISVRIGF